MTLLRGNNGEIRQNGWCVLAIDDWHYQDGALRAEYAEFVPPEDDRIPMRVTLRNGDQTVVEGLFATYGEICEDHRIARLHLHPVIMLERDSATELDEQGR